FSVWRGRGFPLWFFNADTPLRRHADTFLLNSSNYACCSVALVSFDPAWRLAWSEPRHGMALFGGAWTSAPLPKGCVRSACADCPWTRTSHRNGCITRLRDRCRDPVPMAPDRWRGDPVYCRVLEALARATSYLGRYVRRFLGSDPLVLAHGECAWSRPHGRAGPSRSEIDFLRNSSIQRKLAALLSTPGRHRRGRHSYDLSFSCLWTSCLDRIRLHWAGGAAPLMDQP